MWQPPPHCFSYQPPAHRRLLSRSFSCDSLNAFTMLAYPGRCVMGSHVSPSFFILSNELCTASSSPFHHQSGCENPHQFPQSVCIPVRIKEWRCCSLGIDCFPLSEVCICSFFYLISRTVISAPARVAGCGALHFSTDCVRDAGAHFCGPLPPSPPRLGRITAALVLCSHSKTLQNKVDNFGLMSPKRMARLFFVGCPCTRKCGGVVGSWK